jgi:hypothetical protein
MAAVNFQHVRDIIHNGRVRASKRPAIIDLSSDDEAPATKHFKVAATQDVIDDDGSDDEAPTPKHSQAKALREFVENIVARMDILDSPFSIDDGSSGEEQTDEIKLHLELLMPTLWHAAVAMLDELPHSPTVAELRAVWTELDVGRAWVANYTDALNGAMENARMRSADDKAEEDEDDEESGDEEAEPADLVVATYEVEKSDVTTLKHDAYFNTYDDVRTYIDKLVEIRDEEDK